VVLWTKESMKGDVWIEYEYTRIDSEIAHVNILYIQATGESPYSTDILEWSDARKVPAMRTYYNHMNTLHLSYAAFDSRYTDSESDYIRARRYMPALNKGLPGTEIGQSYEKSGLFQTGVPHKITVIKDGFDLYMYIENNEKGMLCHWNYSAFPAVDEGRIGLRHMYTRGARYANFKVLVLDE